MVDETLLELGGRSHAYLLHLPLGVLAALIACEIWGAVRRRPLERSTRLLLAWFLVATAGVSAGSGMLLSREPGFAGEMIEVHRWLGIAMASALMVAAVLATAGLRRGYVGGLVLALLVAIPLLIPVAVPVPVPVPVATPVAIQVEQPKAYENEVAPIFEAQPARGPRRLPIAAMAALRDAHVHVEVIDPESRLLWIDFTSRPEMPPDDVVPLLAPLAPHTSELSLRGVAGANEILVRSGPWTELRALDLSRAAVDRDGLAAAASAGRLVELTLTGASVTPEAAAHLPTLDSIQRIHVWDADLPEGTLAALRERQPALELNDGSLGDAAPPEAEPEFEFGVAGPGAGATASLSPVNSACPVSGAPVVAKFSIVHEGRVVGFCCEKCPGRFWEDPSAFPVE